MSDTPTIRCIILQGEKLLAVPGPRGYDLPTLPVEELDAGLTLARWTQAALGQALAPVLRLTAGALHLYAPLITSVPAPEGYLWADLRDDESMSPDTARALEALLQADGDGTALPCRGLIWQVYGAGGAERDRAVAGWRREEAERNVGRRGRTALLMAALALGVGYDLLFLHGYWGVSAPVFVLALLMTGGWLHRKDAGARSPAAWAVGGLAFVLSWGWVLHNDPVLTAVNFFLVPLLTAASLRMLTTLEPWTPWRVALYGLIKLFTDALRWCGRIFPVAASLPRRRAGLSPAAKAVWLGVAAAVPLLIVVVTLLAHADALFMEALRSAFTWLGRLNAQDILLHTVLSAVFAVYFFGLLWSGIYRRRDRPRPLGRPLTPWLSPLTAVVALVPVLMVYGLFVGIQFTYLFRGSGAMAGTLTFAAYARRGFFQLVVVALINMGLALTMAKAGLWWLDKPGWRAVFRVLLTLLIGCTLVMLASAMVRMMQYIAAYGYTWLRIAASLMMVMLAVMQGVLLLRVFRRSMAVAPCLALIAAAFLVVMNCMGVGRMAARQNVDRYFASGSTQSLDLDFLRREAGVDAAPEVLRLMSAPDESVRAAAEDYFSRPDAQAILTGNGGLRWNLGRQRFIDAYGRWKEGP